MSKTVLVIDDDSSISSIFSFILEQAGFKTVSVPNTEDCLSLIKSDKKFEIIFLDIKPTDGSGLKMFKKILQIRPEALVIVMSGYTIGDPLKEAFELGAYGVLYKPFDVEEAMATVDKIFKLPALS
jgi:DNA-binding NtrC family response regulator